MTIKEAFPDAHITYQRNKKTGAVYVYSVQSYWDKEKKAPRNKQLYLRKLKQRAVDRAVGCRRLRGPQLRHPDPHPAQVHGGRRGAEHDDDLPVPPVLGRGHRRPGHHPRHPAHPVRQGPAHRLRPALALGEHLPVGRKNIIRQSENTA